MSTERPEAGDRQYIIPEQYRRMIEWMVFSYDEKDRGNLQNNMAGDLGISADDIKAAITRLEKITECDDLVASMTRLIRYSVRTGQFPLHKIQNSKISLKPMEESLITEFKRGRRNSQIMETLRISLDDLNRHKHDLYKQVGAKNRFYAVAYAEKRNLDPHL